MLFPVPSAEFDATVKVPALRTELPLNVLFADRVSVPAPFLVSEPEPSIMPVDAYVVPAVVTSIIPVPPDTSVNGLLLVVVDPA